MSQSRASQLVNAMLGRTLVPDSKARVDGLRVMPGVSQWWRNPPQGRTAALLLLSDSTEWDTGTTNGGAWPNTGSGGYLRAFGALANLLAASGNDVNVVYWLNDFTNGNNKYQAPRVLHTATGGPSRATLPGTSGATLFYAKTNANRLTGTHHFFAAKVKPTDWTPSAAQTIISDWGNTGQGCWSLGINTDGTLWFSVTTDGTTVVNRFSSVAPSGVVDATTILDIGVDVQWNNGSGGATFTFYTSTDGDTWTQLGTAATYGAVLTPFQSTAPYQIGCRTIGGGAGSNFAGDVYDVQIRSGGMYGPTLAPICPDQWEQNPLAPGYPTPGNPFNPFNGSPTLHLVNASWPGQGLTQFDDPTNLPLLVPHFPYLGVILNTGHNDSISAVTAGALADKWDRMLARVERRAPHAEYALLTQNPTLRADAVVGDPNSLRYDHTARMARLAAYAQSRGIGVIDTFQSFGDWTGGSGLADLLDPAGAGANQIIHPYGPGVTRQAAKLYDEVFAA